MWGFNPLRNWWKPSNYTHWYHYIWLAPILGSMVLYLIVGNFIYNLFRKK